MVQFEWNKAESVNYKHEVYFPYSLFLTSGEMYGCVQHVLMLYSIHFAAEHELIRHTSV